MSNPSLRGAGVAVVLGLWAPSAGWTQQRDPAILYLQGQTALVGEYLDSARTLLQESYALERHSHTAYLLAVTYSKLRQPTQTTEFAHAALRDQPTLAEEYRSGARALLVWAHGRVVLPARVRARYILDDPSQRPRDLITLQALRDSARVDVSEVPSALLEFGVTLEQWASEVRRATALDDCWVASVEQLRACFKDLVNEELDEVPPPPVRVPF